MFTWLVCSKPDLDGKIFKAKKYNFEIIKKKNKTNAFLFWKICESTSFW